jgi:hypothetical protein
VDDVKDDADTEIMGGVDERRERFVGACRQMKQQVEGVSSASLALAMSQRADRSGTRRRSRSYPREGLHQCTLGPDDTRSQNDPRDLIAVRGVVRMLHDAHAEAGRRAVSKRQRRSR